MNDLIAGGIVGLLDGWMDFWVNDFWMDGLLDG